MMEWIEAHPVVVALLWPMLSALVTACFKPKTPEQYASMPPRLGAFLKLIGSLGIDAPNMLEAVKQGFKGKSLSAVEYRATRGEFILPPEPTEEPK